MTTLTAAMPSAGGPAPGYSARPSSPTTGGLTGADIVRIIRQRLVLILVVWFFFIGATAGATALTIKYYPSYSGESLVRVESAYPVNVMNPLERVTVNRDEVERLVLNQTLMVVSPEVLTRALEDADLRRTKWFAEADEDERKHGKDKMLLLADTVRCGPVKDTNYLRVATSWRYPEEVPILVNTVVDKYMGRVEELQVSGIRDLDAQLGKELNTALSEYDRLRTSIENMRSSEEALTEGGEGPSERLLTLLALVTELEVEMLGRRTQWEALENARPEDIPITPDLQALLDQDPIIIQLQGRLQAADDALVVAQERFGRNHRVVREAQVVRDTAADRLAEERAVKVSRYQTDQIDQARRSYLEAQEQLLSLRELSREARAEQQDRDAKYARYMHLVEERDLARLQYENLLEQKNLVTMTLRLPKAVQIEVRSTAIQPKTRTSPQWYIWMPAGTILGLAVSLGLGLLIELADKSVRTPKDVQPLSTLGIVPTSDDDEVEIERVETACLDAPHSIIAEAFRNLRANLFFSAPAEQQGVVLVTSPSGSNGKTTVATNLATAMAMSGRRVLLIDANFRRPGLPKLFSDMREEGLSNGLIGQGRLPDLVSPTSVPGLDVMSSGPIPPNPAELLGGSYLRDILVDARSQYDQVLIDGPPILLVSDAMVLAGAADGILLVCQYRATSRGALQRCRAQLEGIGARVFGIVLNLVESRAGGYFRKLYREFYEYQEPEEGEEGAVRKRLDLQTAVAPLQPTDVGHGGGRAKDEDEEPPEPPSTGGGRPRPGPGTPPAPASPAGGVAADEVARDEDWAAAEEHERGEPPSGGSLSETLPQLDDEIEKLGADDDFGDLLDTDDDLKLEDLDLPGDSRPPDRDSQEDDEPPPV